MHKLGGRGRESQIKTWKETKWTLNLHPTEIVPKTRKRKAQNVFVQSQVKKMAQLQEDFESCQQTLKATSLQLKKAEETNKKLVASFGPHVSKHHQSWTEYSAQYQRQQKRQIASDMSTALEFTKYTFFQPLRVEMVNKETNELVTVNDNGSLEKLKEQLTPENKDTIVKQTLYVKERLNVSDKAYHELSMIRPSLPCWSTINKVAKNINSCCDIYPTPGPILGVQQSLKNRLTTRLQTLVNKYPSIKDEAYIRVKLTGDGTRVSRSMHIVVIAFSILNVNENPNSPGGNHVIALLNTVEKYEQLSDALKDIEEEIKSTQSLTIDGHKFQIKYFFSADMKYLAVCLGLQAANADYSCICPKEQRHNTSKSWEDELRTIEEIQQLALKKKYGCIQQPLFPSIPIDHVIPDILHLFLRISDVLTNLLILDLRRMDGIEKIRESEFKQTKAKNLDQYITFLNVNCKIPFYMYVDKESKHLKWRDLTGPEKVRLFRAIKIPELFPALPSGEKVQQLWENLKDSLIYKVLWSSKKLDKPEIKDFTTKAKSWIMLFTDTYQTRHVTPYMHVLVAHIPTFLEKFGSLAIYSQQGLEKLNDEITKAYFKSTNHHNKTAMIQIMLKLNRLETLTDENYQRTTRMHTCSKCKEVGHNSKTCPTHN